jgi:hypothetical protein
MFKTLYSFIMYNLLYCYAVAWKLQAAHIAMALAGARYLIVAIDVKCAALQFKNLNHKRLLLK